MTTAVRHAVALVAATSLLCGAGLIAQALQRSMYVTVVDEEGAPIESVEALRPGDFAIREDDDARQVVGVVSAEEPMHVTVLIDTSAAARDHIGDLAAALGPFVADMTRGSKHQLSIVGVGSKSVVIPDAAPDRDRVMTAAAAVFDQRGSGNYLLDGLIQAAEGIGKRAVQRPVIVAITTETPEISAPHQEVLKPLQQAGASFHVLVLGAPSAGEAPPAGPGLLNQGPRLTGGRRETVAKSALPAALKRLSNELTHQYLVCVLAPGVGQPAAAGDSERNTARTHCARHGRQRHRRAGALVVQTFRSARHGRPEGLHYDSLGRHESCLTSIFHKL